jgi:hypothetical protein
MRPSDNDVKYCSDASGTIGMGATSTTGHYYQIRWTNVWAGTTSVDIYLAETLAMTVFLDLMRPLCKGQFCTLYVDNTSTQAAFINKRCKYIRKDVSQLIKYSCRMANIDGFRFWGERITTDENVIADALSRFTKVKPESQDKKFGHHTLTHRFTTKEVRDSIRRVLGHLWNTSTPPHGYPPVPV